MLKIKNKSKARIVINSLNVILSSAGTNGDTLTLTVKSENDLGKDILSLKKSGYLSVSPAGKAERCGDKPVENPTPKADKQKQKKAPKSKAIFVDEGKVKTKKMVQSLEHEGSLPNPLTIDDQERDGGEEKLDDRFV